MAYALQRIAGEVRRGLMRTSSRTGRRPGMRGWGMPHRTQRRGRMGRAMGAGAVVGQVIHMIRGRQAHRRGHSTGRPRRRY